MTYRHRRRKVLSVLAGIPMIAATLLVGGMQPGSQARAAGVPPAFAQGFSEIVKAVTPAVVNIAVTGGGEGRREGRRQLPPGGPFGGPPPGPGDEPPGMEPPGGPGGPPGPPGGGPHRPEQSAGSGVVLDSNGYIVTNNHVVEGATQITVTLSDRREFPAKIIGTDPKTDLAIIKIEAKDLASMKWADYDELHVGDLVLAVGSPFGLSSTVTLGIISALGRGNVGIADYEDFIQTDAAINPGNSGGALVNMEGKLIGITIQEITPALAKSFKLPEQRKGVLISDVNENGPSHSAGMRRGDVVIAFNGKEVQSVSQLRNLVARMAVGKDADIKILREGKEQSLKVKVAERPSDEVLAKREPGPTAPQTETVKPPDNVLASLRVQMLDAAMQSQLNIPAKTSGVVVSSVEAGSAAESAGLQRGDVIQEVNHEVVKSLEDYQKASAKVKKDEMVVLLLSRQGNNLFVAVNPK